MDETVKYPRPIPCLTCPTIARSRGNSLDAQRALREFGWVLTICSDCGLPSKVYPDGRRERISEAELKRLDFYESAQRRAVCGGIRGHDDRLLPPELLTLKGTLLPKQRDG